MKNVNQVFYVPKKKLVMIIMGMVIVFTVLTILLLRSSNNEPKATWLWDSSQILTDAEEIIAFAKEQGVNTIFLQIGTEVNDAAYRRFNSAASVAKIEVHALNGHPEWALRDYRGEAVDFLAWLTRYNELSTPEERFAGVQFDVEPYLLKNWSSEQSKIVEQWLESARVWVEISQREGIRIGAAIPFWLDDIEHVELGEEGNLGKWMVEKFDYVAIMAYRNKAADIYDISRSTLQVADEQNKQVWVGVELTESQEGPQVSFYDQPLKTMKKELDKLALLVDEHTSFKGIAIHSYESWLSKEYINVAQSNATLDSPDQTISDIKQ